MIAKKYWPFYTVSQHCLGYASQHGDRRLLLTEWADVEGLTQALFLTSEVGFKAI